MFEENENILNSQNKCICNICNLPDKYILCETCFGIYNEKYNKKKNNLISSEKKISEKIYDILISNKEKSNKLNAKLYLEKKNQFLLQKKVLEEERIKILKEEDNKYENLIIEQEDKNSRLKVELDKISKKINNDTKQEDDAIKSISDITIINRNNNSDDNIDNIKNEIFEINSKIIKYKQKYIFNLFEESFIKNKTYIKITDFFNVSSEVETNDINRLNFSIMNDQKKVSNEIYIDILLKKHYYLKRFNSFFKSMISFLEKAYNKFKLKMPYKINYPKISNNEGFEYKIELKSNELKEQMVINSAINGFHLLNIDYEYLINYFFGDSKRIKYLFDLTIFRNDKNDDFGSLKNIEEESKIEQNTDNNFGFEVIDDNFI